MLKKDIFEKENNVSLLKQIKYGEEIGLGPSSYQLIEILDLFFHRTYW